MIQGEPSSVGVNGFDILVVDDDHSIRDALATYLARHGFRVRAAEGAAEFDRLFAERQPDLVILDVMMPDEDGLSICKRTAPTGVPILILSALGETTDRIVGLEVGAWDYLGKPFDPRELLARVRTLLRREQIIQEAGDVGFRFVGWCFDPDARVLRDPADRVASLTHGEVALLRAFVERPGRLLTRDRLLDLARGPDAAQYDRAIDLAVSRLRRRFGAAGTDLIQTVRGEGYRFGAAVERR